MYMNKLIILLFGLLLFGCKNQEQPTASDCITRIEFLWGNESERDKTGIISGFMDSFVSHYISVYGTNSPPPSSAVQGLNQEFIYLQYAANCNNKVEITKLITDKVVLDSEAVPVIAFSNSNFKPGYDTIFVDGPYWRSDQ